MSLQDPLRQSTSASSSTLLCHLSTTSQPAFFVSIFLPFLQRQDKLTVDSYPNGTPEFGSQPRLLRALQRGGLYAAQGAVRHAIETRIPVGKGAAERLTGPAGDPGSGDHRQAACCSPSAPGDYSHWLLQPGRCHRRHSFAVDGAWCDRGMFVLWVWVDPEPCVYVEYLGMGQRGLR